MSGVARELWVSCGTALPSWGLWGHAPLQMDYSSPQGAWARREPPWESIEEVPVLRVLGLRQVLTGPDEVTFAGGMKAKLLQSTPDLELDTDICTEPSYGARYFLSWSTHY